MLRREEVETLSDTSEETEETKETQNTRNTCCDCENTDGEDESLSKKEHGTLKSGRLALMKLKESSFDERDVTKHSFKALQHTFKNFTLEAKKTQNDTLLNYLCLMEEIIDYVETPQFKMFFQKFDKKLRKNVIKRCAINPLAEKVLV